MFLPTKTKINYVIFLVFLILSNSEMATVRSEVSKFLRILAHPIFPASANPELNTSGQKVTFLLFVQVVSALFVFIGVFAAEQAVSNKAKLGNWIIVMLSVTIGVIALFVLIVRGCQNKLRVHRRTLTRMSDPSLNLRILFLWIFGLAVIIQVIINFAIYIQCITSFRLQDMTQVVFTLMSNVTMLIFLLIQTSFISYYRNATFVKNNVVNIASIVILSTNFAIWFNTLVSSINVFDMYVNTTIPRYSNESYCFRTSSIQTELGSKVRPFLLPPRLEFCILASSFIISFWRLPIEPVIEYPDNSINREDYCQTTSTHRRHQLVGAHIFATVFAIFLNTPIFLTMLLLDFAFNWKQDDVFFALDLGESISSLFNVIAIYVCSYHLVSRFENSWRPARLNTNEYILILSSSGVMGYFMFGLLTALSSPIPVNMFLITRISSLLETFLQTYFLLKIKRCITEGRTSVLISSTGILMMVKNLMFWFLNSYSSSHHSTKLDLVLVDSKSWVYIRNIFGPLMTFYRFFSGMMSYSVYYKFRPNR